MRTLTKGLALQVTIVPAVVDRVVPEAITAEVEIAAEEVAAPKVVPTSPPVEKLPPHPNSQRLNQSFNFRRTVSCL